ncbi:MAG: 16S rRNA (guanine(966)-N(2))-methyltransferase RsmD [Gammaproteobacteria bacterium]
MKRKGAGRGGGRVRIIAGRWRGRLIRVPDGPGLRPTPDRVRETVFSWLQTALPGRRCLDLFAGSGALGLEAASRQARELVMVEQSAGVARQLLDSVTELLGDAGSHEEPDIRVVRADALAWLRNPPSHEDRFDVVFLDPPYGKGLLQAAITTLHEQDWLSERARLYIEFSTHESAPELPEGYTWTREKSAGEVRFGLAMRE